MKKSIAIFTHDPECSDECCDGLITSLKGEYNLKLFDETEFNRDTLENVDMVAFGGGIGDADKFYEFIHRREGNFIAEFIESGGRYLGICMGAYWACGSYFGILRDLDAVQYIRRPKASVRRSYATVTEVDWLGESYDMFFYDGPTFIGEGDFKLISSYPNSDPMAIIQNRVGLIGCHPESEEFWFSKKYLKKYWHKGTHHKLLRDFVETLMRS
jgi:glutamine amidotransferase-like uncharacterized protein